MKAKWKISPIPQSPNPNQRPQLRSGLLVPVARTAGPGVRCERPDFGKEDRLLGQNERVLSLPESHTRRISAPSRNSWQGDAMLPLCQPGDTHRGCRCLGALTVADPYAERQDLYKK